MKNVCHGSFPFHKENLSISIVNFPNVYSVKFKVLQVLLPVLGKEKSVKFLPLMGNSASRLDRANKIDHGRKSHVVISK